MQTSVVVAHVLNSCGSRALEHRLNNCGAHAELPLGMWDLPRPGTEPTSPALAGGLFITEPPGKPWYVFNFTDSFFFLIFFFLIIFYLIFYF